MSLTQRVIRPVVFAGLPGIRVFPVRTPTLPPATHTNVYVVGTGHLAVIDPASPYPEEQTALDDYLDGLAATGERVEEILLTHHHIDHVSGVVHLAERLNVPIAAHPTTRELLAGRITVAREIADGERLQCGGVTLRALFTPGHAPGHHIFFDESSRSIIAGDMVASIGTIIIDPPEGDMQLYLDSLKRMRQLAAKTLLPAHGPAVEDPEQLLSFYIAHRREREARVIAALAANGEGATIEALLPAAYPDVAPSLYPLAARSLLAHLLKLRTEGRAIDHGNRWAPVRT